MKKLSRKQEGEKCEHGEAIVEKETALNAAIVQYNTKMAEAKEAIEKAQEELKRLEARLFERIEERKKDEKGQRQIGFVHANQFFGIDINPFAVEIAKVQRFYPDAEIRPVGFMAHEV